MWYAGTADALYQNLDILRMQEPRFVLVLAGDHVYKMDYGVMLAEHVESGADLSIACIDMPVEAASSSESRGWTNDGRLQEFVEKPMAWSPIPGNPACALVSMGIYVFNADLSTVSWCGTRVVPSRRMTSAMDIIPRLLREGGRVYAHRFSNSCVNMVGGHPYWRDVGTVDAYWEANMDLTRVQPELNMYDPQWPIRTLEDHLPPAKFVFESADPRGQAFDALVSSGCIVSGASIVRSSLFTDVMVECGSVVEDSVLLPKVRIGRNVRLHHAVVDKFCVIPDGFAAGLDRAEDEARFHVTPRGVVLITPEMLGQELHEFG